MHCPHGEETGEVLLLVPHHHAVAHEVPQLGLDLLLDGVGGDVLAPAGDDHILDPTWGEGGDGTKESQIEGLNENKLPKRW